jgi:TRAP-type C4-dicarboxylate transport system permease large subunit
MCCNAWLLVAITTDRWIRVRFPFKSKQFCTRRNAFIAAIIIIILSAGFNGHILEPDYGQLPAGIMTVCGPKPTNTIYNTFVRQIWPIIFSCIQTVLPVILLVILSIDTFHRLARQTVTQNTQHVRRRTQLDNQILLIMLATIIMFVATNLPLGLFNILMTPVLRQFMNQIQLLQLSSIFTFIASINYALDFYIHCLTSRLFRQELLHIFKCSNRTNRISTITNTLRVNPTGLPMTQIQI